MADGDVKVSLTANNAKACNIFDGVDDYVEITHNNRQLGSMLKKGFTISAWINPRSLGEAGNGNILDKSTAVIGANGFSYYITTTGASSSARFRINNGTGGNSTNASVNFGVWTHVLVTISSAQIGQHYINGIASNVAWDNVQGISTITTTNAPRIGNRSVATDRTFDGSIKGVKMWNKVLSATEIAQEYAGVTPASANLIHHFKLGGDYTDYGIVGVTATNSGSVPAIVDSSLATVVKGQRVGATDKWLIYRGKQGQVGTVEIEE